jgi:uncharacterized protein YjeT (DUF2065 family)
MYLSYLAILSVIFARRHGRAGRLPPLPVSLTILAFGLLMVLDGLNSTFAELGVAFTYTPRNDLRLLTGMGAGIGLALIILLVANNSLRRDVDDRMPALGGWHDLGLVLALKTL